MKLISFNKVPAGVFRGFLGEVDTAKEMAKELQIAQWKKEVYEKSAERLAKQAQQQWWKPQGMALKQKAKEAALKVTEITPQIETAKLNLSAIRANEIAQKLSEEAVKKQTKESINKAAQAAQKAMELARKVGDQTAVSEWQKYINETKESIKDIEMYEKSLKEAIAWWANLSDQDIRDLAIQEFDPEGRYSKVDMPWNHHLIQKNVAKRSLAKRGILPEDNGGYTPYSGRSFIRK